MTSDVSLASYPGLDDRIVVIRAGDEVDAVFVGTERFNVLVDTLGTPSLCRRALDLLADRMRDRPLIVVNSHMDWDHFWGNSAVRGVPIVAHQSAIERLRDPATLQTLEQKRKTEHRFNEVELVSPTLTFSGGSMTLHGGDLSLHLLHTPGHTPDHLAVWIPELETCLAVDAVEHPIPEVWSSAPEDLRSLRSSLNLIRSLKPKQLVLAHGQTSDPAVLDRNIAYFETIQKAVSLLPVSSLPSEGLHEYDGMRLEEFVDLPSDISSEAQEFYRRCHRSNLEAAVATHIAATAFS
ncbi:glyoxylase-like metal-dependent hydrolase (beta-lactamase superfamily II) [Agrobacterium larrymoorei]|uniref:Glyoxylase-like metal-dependent hydrolase (Beta-lactamase superfamily II) n=1 Tax=Agrobacterium larrymoorei TaxID=160699 RepID=A0AAJ2ETX9_9HYPH|nr:MBL fold metallo-hydrolase [Agrobacterium larrymoorei]MDR6102998.1 glyoxylase-like metal-dependent hydrolase (beta-lactamase superfamily II) [Agrobacterium larrymoorei]